MGGQETLSDVTPRLAYLFPVGRNDADVIKGHGVHGVVYQCLEVLHDLYGFHGIKPGWTITLSEILTLNSTINERTAVHKQQASTN